MFTKVVSKTKELIVSGKLTLYIGMIALAFMLVSTLMLVIPTAAFGPMPGGVGG